MVWLIADTAVAIFSVKNPILAAAAVLRHTRHTLLASHGAEQLARAHGLAMCEADYFVTDLRRDQLRRQLAEETAAVQCDHDYKATGTVGAVALDNDGRLASASSTGGLSGKMPGRVSDSSIPGAGHWADKGVAVSGTGDGDWFMARAACRHIADLVSNNKGETLQQACETAVNGPLSANLSKTKMKQDDKAEMGKPAAGVIGLDRMGNRAVAMNTPGMFYAYWDETSGDVVVKIFRDE